MNTVNDDGYTDKDYSALYGEISNYSREDVLPEIEQRQMTAEAYGRISLCSRVYKEALACLSYDEYLDSVNEKADEIPAMEALQRKMLLKRAESTVSLKVQCLRLWMHRDF